MRCQCFYSAVMANSKLDYSYNASPTMSADDKKEITDMVNGLFNALRVDLEKESTANKAALSSLHESIEAGKKSNKLGLTPECFTGSTEEDAN